MLSHQLFSFDSDLFVNYVKVFVITAVADRLAAAIVSEAITAIVSTCLKGDLEVLLEKAVKHRKDSTDGNDSAYNDKQCFETVRIFLVFVHNVLLSPPPGGVNSFIEDLVLLIVYHIFHKMQ